MGGCPLGGYGWGDTNDEAAQMAVKTALESGITFFDTADVYGLGHSEELLSRSLGTERYNVCIATKGGMRWDSCGKCTKDISPVYIRSALQASLKRLKLDKIKLYYLHWPDGHTHIESTMEELVRCREKGMIDEIGLSNFSAEDIEKAIKIVPIAAIQIQYSLVDQGPVRLLQDTIKANKLALITWGSLAQGLLSGKYDEHSCFESNDRRSRDIYVNFHGEKLNANMKVVRLLKQYAQELDKTPAQVAIRWLLDTEPVSAILFGAKNPNQVLDNTAAVGWTLEKEKKQALAELGQKASQL